MNAINKYGMKTGIVKVRPPQEWKDELPRYDQTIKPIKLRDAIKQDIMGTAGTYRQANIVSQRSYNVPQWRALCEQSDHQPPAKRGERRANQDKHRAATKAKPRKGGRRSSRRAGDDEDAQDGQQRLPTPDSPNGGSDDERKPPATSVSARRKYNRKEAATRIDEEAFKDFDYELHEEFSRERCEELERAYWKTLTYASPLYGADMVGTLFTDKTKHWNLSNLPNLLDVLGTKIPGVNTAYLYMGMWKATFAWHLEDVDLYSINYLHFGAPKQWYSISQGDARKFEAAMKSVWPTDAKACDQFLRHKTFLISPTTLLNTYGIKVNKIVHHPGEFVITFPYGYHSGYNLGYNCAEAVNFALDSWMDFGRIAKRCDCDQAQDSVWINIREIERKLNGEPTDDELSEEDEEEDEEMVDMPTPPYSNGELKTKLKNNKRKRATKEKGGNTTFKKIKIRMKAPVKEPCALCPFDIPSEALLDTTDGRKVHRICADYIPETEIDVEDGQETVYGMDSILKARLGLECKHCKSKKGACFQCSQGKCSRSYHATCAAAAGVWAEKAETSVFGEDGTEYSVPAVEFSCRFHRAKRPKKATEEVLEKDLNIRKAALELKAGDFAQFQHIVNESHIVGNQYFAGIIIENNSDEDVLIVKILPRCADLVEVEYKYLRLPEPSDFRMVRPSTKAIPLPKRPLATSKRFAEDKPRKDDVFIPGLKWAEFALFDVPKNMAQAKTDLSKQDHFWHYLGKTSTDARAQYTENPARPQNNPRAHFLESIPKKTHHTAPRTSIPASFPAPPNKPNQNAINAAAYASRQFASGNGSKTSKPYAYKPRDAQISQQNYSMPAKATPAQQYYNSQSFSRSADGLATSPYTTWASQQYSTGLGTHGSRPAPYQSPISVPRPSYNAAGTPVALKRPSEIELKKPNRQSSSGNGVLVKDPFIKYPYLATEHNRSPSLYKSPYKQGSGFMNGYEGNLAEHLKRNPSALSQFGMSDKKEYAPILPPGKSHLSKSDGKSLTVPPEERRPSYSEQWEKKDSAGLHPAIRSQFHNKSESTAHQESRAPLPVQATPSPTTGGSFGGSLSDSIPKYDSHPILPPKYVGQRQTLSTPQPQHDSTVRGSTSCGLQSAQHLQSPAFSVPTLNSYSAPYSHPRTSPTNTSQDYRGTPPGAIDGVSLNQPPYFSPQQQRTASPAPSLANTYSQTTSLAQNKGHLQVVSSQSYSEPSSGFIHQSHSQSARSAVGISSSNEVPMSTLHAKNGNMLCVQHPRNKMQIDEILDLPPDSSTILEKMLTNLRKVASNTME